MNHCCIGLLYGTRVENSHGQVSRIGNWILHPYIFCTREGFRLVGTYSHVPHYSRLFMKPVRHICTFYAHCFSFFSLVFLFSVVVDFSFTQYFIFIFFVFYMYVSRRGSRGGAQGARAPPPLEKMGSHNLPRTDEFFRWVGGRGWGGGLHGLWKRSKWSVLWRLWHSSNFCFNYAPKWTVSSLNFEKFSGEGLTEPPSPDPSPRYVSGFALGSGFALDSRALRALVCPPEIHPTGWKICAPPNEIVRISPCM